MKDLSKEHVICDCCNLECVVNGSYFRTIEFPASVIDMSNIKTIQTKEGEWIAISTKGLFFDLCYSCSQEYHNQAFSIFSKMKQGYSGD